ELLEHGERPVLVEKPEEQHRPYRVGAGQFVSDLVRLVLGEPLLQSCDVVVVEQIPQGPCRLSHSRCALPPVPPTGRAPPPVPTTGVPARKRGATLGYPRSSVFAEPRAVNLSHIDPAAPDTASPTSENTLSRGSADVANDFL